jgi:hypothetical protein
MAPEKDKVWRYVKLAPEKREGDKKCWIDNFEGKSFNNDATALKASLVIF